MDTHETWTAPEAPRASLYSGRWRGYYLQGGVEYPQQQRMEFADGIVRGEGDDRIGTFRIEGEYASGAGQTRIGWVKTYDRGHSVLYLGVFDGSWIRGSWEIGGYGEGFGFRPSASDIEREATR